RPLDEKFLAQRATALNFWLHLLFQDKRWKTRLIAIFYIGNPSLNLVIVKYKRPLKTKYINKWLTSYYSKLERCELLDRPIHTVVYT
ncbi:MAG: hypothetical protein KBF25_03265, partial [Chitinophagaceae bacterium]|nr:hypothetical protein [Chitinophagaceae bacterium]